MNNIPNTINIGLLIANIFLIIFNALMFYIITIQTLQSRRAILNFKIKKEKNDITKKDDLVYLYLENRTKTTARNIRIETNYKVYKIVNSKKEKVSLNEPSREQIISYLNPNEKTKTIILLPDREINKEYGSLFEEEKINKKRTATIPKKDLEIITKIKIEYEWGFYVENKCMKRIINLLNQILFAKEKFNVHYITEWYSLNKIEDKEKHPVIIHRYIRDGKGIEYIE